MKKQFDKIDNARYYESFSNFAVVKLPGNLNSIEVEKIMEKKKILVMGGHKIGLGEKYIRIHMSGVTKIEMFITEFRNLLLRL